MSNTRSMSRRPKNRTRRKHSMQIAQPINFDQIGKIFKFTQPIQIGKQQAIQPALPIQQEQQRLGREVVELIWEIISPGSLRVFQLSEKAVASTNLSEGAKRAAGIAGISAFFYGLHKLSETLDN